MSQIDEILKVKHKYVEAVVGFLVREDEILLGERLKVSRDLGKNTFAGVGGKVDPGETSDEALVREVMEEVGTEITKYEKFGRIRFLNPGRPEWDFDVSAYFVYEWKNEPKESEVMRPVWFKNNELPMDKMWKDNIDWLPRALNGEKIDMIYLFEEGNVIESKNIIQLKNN